MESIGPYRVVGSLGSGGMAEVFLAERRGPSGFVKRVAIKIVKPVDAAEEEESRKRFEAEARLSGILEHPNIVRVYDFDQDPRPYLVMEYVEGVSVLQFLRRLILAKERVPFELAAFIGAKIGRGLEHAHVQFGSDGEPLGLIHRDVSAANVLLSYQGEVKLTDFGIAQSVNNPWKTLTGTVLGKTSYMSPEQAVGELIDARSDIFSAGVVLWELLTMRPLYPQSDPEAQKRRSARIAPPRALDADPTVPRELSDIAARALDPDVRHRTATAGELADELDEYLSGRRSSPRERTLGALLERHFPRKQQSGEEEATIVETALPEAVRARIEQDISRRRKDETPTASDARTVQEPTLPEDDPSLSVRVPHPAQAEEQSPVATATPIVPVQEPLGATLVGLGVLADGEPSIRYADEPAVDPTHERRLEPQVSPRSGRSIGPEEPTRVSSALKDSRGPGLIVAIGLLVVAIVATLVVFLTPGWSPLGAGSPAGSGAVWQMRSTPDGFRVFVNERLAGETPLDLDWSEVPEGAAVTALRDGFPPLVALGRALESYRLGLTQFPGAIAPYPTGAGNEPATVALHRLEGKIVGYSVIRFPSGVPTPAQEQVRELGRELSYQYAACRPAVPCVVGPM